MPNERDAEAVVLRHFHTVGITEANGFAIDSQRPKLPVLDAALATASKHGTGRGMPEFTVYPKDEHSPRNIIVVECKASTRDHAKAEAEVLHYAYHLNAGRNVIAVAQSGTNDTESRWTFFVVKADDSLPRPTPGWVQAHQVLRDPVSTERYRSLPDWAEIIDAVTYAPVDEAELLNFAKTFHNFIRSEGEVNANDKPLLVAGSLIALEDTEFEAVSRTGSISLNLWYTTILDVLTARGMNDSRKESMRILFETVKGNRNLGAMQKNGKPLIHDIVVQLRDRVFPHVKQGRTGYDIVGQFYGEFLRYTLGDQKDGIVLTPPHIVRLFADIADLKPTDVVYDPCSGTGGFLVAAMSKMMHGTNHEQQQEIKDTGLVGIEFDPRMFTLASANMLLRGDGKAHFYLGSSLPNQEDDALTKIRSLDRQPTVGMANPPYSKKGQPELAFIESMLDTLVPGGRGLAIVPVSCASGASSLRNGILSKHRLEAVMTMPPGLFHKVGTHTCIMVFTAWEAHESDPYHKTWFARWADDGFIVKKNRRVDGGDWNSMRDKWLSAFRNRDDIPGFSLKRRIAPGDEWLAEAYLPTDYSTLTQEDFERTLRAYSDFVSSSDGEKKLRVGNLFDAREGASLSGEILVSLVGGESIAAVQAGDGPVPQPGVSLMAKNPLMSIKEKRYWAYAITEIAGETLSPEDFTSQVISLPLPDEIPSWVHERQGNTAGGIFADSTWEEIEIGALFDIRRGKVGNLSAETDGEYPFIGASAQNNGVTSYTDRADFPPNAITVATDGSIAQSFYQAEAFSATTNVSALYPKDGSWSMTPERGLFIATLIRQEQFRYSYGRKMNGNRLPHTKVRLPVTTEGLPDWSWIDTFVRGLPYSHALR